MNFKQYILEESNDILSLKAKADAKKRGLTHQSHNIWKDKQGKEYKWNSNTKRFDVVFNIDEIYTKKFKNWFGDWEKKSDNSSKVIKKGKPIVMFHRTNNNFKIFKIPSFFSSVDIGKDYGNIIKRVYLNIKNPANGKDIIDMAKKLYLPMVDDYGKRLKAYEYFSPNLINTDITQYQVDELIEALKAEGFDGAHVKDFDVPDSWIPFYSNQIKYLNN